MWEPSQTLLPELAQYVSEPAPGLSLLRYHSFSAFEALVRSLRGLPRTVRLVSYRPRAEDSRGSPGALVERCRDLAGPEVPVIFLHPDPDAEAGTDLERQAGFWKTLNSYRENLGALSAQIILTLDDAETASCFHHAKDLVSWCIPKFELTLLPLANVRGGDVIAMEKRDSRNAPATTSLTWDSLYPLLQKEVASGQPLSPQGVVQLLFPLMRHALDSGAVSLANLLISIGDQAAFAEERDCGLWLEMKGDLAVAQGDLGGAKGFFTESKAIAERLAGSDPGNAEWQRDLSVSYGRMANVCEKSEQAAEAKVWWGKAYDTLAGMKARGLHVSPADEGFLVRLRAKAGGK